MSPDWSVAPEAVPYADLGDPQTLNLYAYAANNPVTRTDADGHTPIDDVWMQTGHMMQEVGFAFHLWTAQPEGEAKGGCTSGGCTVNVVAPRPRDIALQFVRSWAWQAWHGISLSFQHWWSTRGCQPGQLCGGTVLPIEGGLEEGAEALSEEGGEAAATRVTTLQTGGNTLNKSTARALNRQFGVDLDSREWGRALEDLKQEYHLPNRFHGKILSNGDYMDANSGTVIDNIRSFLHK